MKKEEGEEEEKLKEKEEREKRCYGLGYDDIVHVLSTCRWAGTRCIIYHRLENSHVKK